MGGFEPVGFAILSAVQSQQRNRAQKNALVARQQMEAQQFDLTRRIQERNKRKQLASLQATQRARFGSAGIGRGGSADAVLNGLAEETEQSIRDARALSQMGLQHRAENTRRARKVSLIDYKAGQARNFVNIGKEGFALLERK